MTSDTNTLRRAIEAAYEKRADLTPSSIDAALRRTIEDCIGLLDSGQARVAEKSGDVWLVNDWLKKAVLLYFRANDNQVIDGRHRALLRQGAAEIRRPGRRAVPRRRRACGAARKSSGVAPTSRPTWC